MNKTLNLCCHAEDLNKDPVFTLVGDPEAPVSDPKGKRQLQPHHCPVTVCFYPNNSKPPHPEHSCTWTVPLYSALCCSLSSCWTLLHKQTNMLWLFLMQIYWSFLMLTMFYLITDVSIQIANCSLLHKWIKFLMNERNNQFQYKLDVLSEKLQWEK